jgi:ATP-dependent DNA ligase
VTLGDFIGRRAARRSRVAQHELHVALPSRRSRRDARAGRTSGLGPRARFGGATRSLDRGIDARVLVRGARARLVGHVLALSLHRRSLGFVGDGPGGVGPCEREPIEPLEGGARRGCDDRDEDDGGSGRESPHERRIARSRLSLAMHLPVSPPVAPMLAKRVTELPEGDAWLFEPKWDGFRVLVFRDGDELLIQSRDEKPLDRYFPELAAPLKAQLPARCVLDGEIVVARGGALDFEALQLRIHPAASRVKLLSKELPASLVFWDLLALGEENLMAAPFEERRAKLVAALGRLAPPLHVTPATTDRALASDWFGRFEGAGLDGVMAKPRDGVYEPNKRVMFKVKHERDCDCVVAGFRWHKGGRGTAVGSLLLGLYDEEGALQHVGVSASFTAAKRRELVEYLAPYRERALEDHPWKQWAGVDPESAEDFQRMPGAKSRWSQGKDLSWEPLRPELVVEVAYDHMQGRRFRHTAQFRRWRKDKPPRECTFAQLEVVPAHELAAIFRGSQGESGAGVSRRPP